MHLRVSSSSLRLAHTCCLWITKTTLLCDSMAFVGVPKSGRLVMRTTFAAGPRSFAWLAGFNTKAHAVELVPCGAPDLDH